MSRGLYFSKALFEGLKYIFGGAYIYGGKFLLCLKVD